MAYGQRTGLSEHPDDAAQEFLLLGGEVGAAEEVGKLLLDRFLVQPDKAAHESNNALVPDAGPKFVDTFHTSNDLLQGGQVHGGEGLHFA